MKNVNDLKLKTAISTFNGLGIQLLIVQHLSSVILIKTYFVAFIPFKLTTKVTFNTR